MGVCMQRVDFEILISYLDTTEADRLTESRKRILNTVGLIQRRCIHRNRARKNARFRLYELKASPFVSHFHLNSSL
ncbi:hypothetical protein HanRHA438_Chr12g0536851 [Helianthus annuus]|nr:hypothetical protein HanIR_Chr12g0565921 [Helianthus annuus]KAJ0865092.1 hypothetical protein HanRHA438_Chr12g0536851 [Helianthus annuus]